MTIAEVKSYEINQYKKAFSEGTSKAWKQYRTNVQRAVNKWNKNHAEKIDIDALMS